MGSMTKYFPGGAVTEVSSPAVALPALAMPSVSGGGVGGGFPDLSGLIARRQAMEDERERRAAELHAMQMKAMTNALDAQDRERLPGFGGGAGTRNPSAGSYEEFIANAQGRAMLEKLSASSGEGPQMTGSNAFSQPFMRSGNAIQQRYGGPSSMLYDDSPWAGTRHIQRIRPESGDDVGEGDMVGRQRREQAERQRAAMTGSGRRGF